MIDLDEALLKDRLKDPEWRLTSGALYKIVTKSEGEENESLIVPFKPNVFQRELMDGLHHRIVILKARQLGFSTLVCILWLDTAMFAADPIRCGIIAQDRESAEDLFGKVKFAYNNLPATLQKAMPLASENKSEIVFAHNGASIKVATSVRGGTLHRLHVSEFGKICAKFADKATEVITGSIPAVPLDGVVIIESTAEGRDGDFYAMSRRAKALQDAGTALTPRDYRLFFFPWWRAQEYRMPATQALTERDQKYFTQVEAAIGHDLDPEQKAWYVATRDSDFSGREERMWQEFPSTFDESFQASQEGAYYANELAVARKQGRITNVPTVSAPVNTFWDVGQGDQTAIWFHQQVGLEDRFIRYYEAAGESLGHYVKYLQDTGYVWGKHFLPHDAAHKRLSESNKSIEEMLQDLGLRDTEIVPRIQDIGVGIQQTRDAFSSCWFDKTGCADGLTHLENYRKDWDSRLGTWKPTPRHDIASDCADSFRQFGQAKSAGLFNTRSRSTRRAKPNWRAL